MKSPHLCYFRLHGNDRKLAKCSFYGTIKITLFPNIKKRKNSASRHVLLVFIGNYTQFIQSKFLYYIVDFKR